MYLLEIPRLAVAHILQRTAVSIAFPSEWQKKKTTFQTGDNSFGLIIIKMMFNTTAVQTLGRSYTLPCPINVHAVLCKSFRHMQMKDVNNN